MQQQQKIQHTEVNGKVHGSQSHIIQDNNISLIVYYEVPDGQREMARQKFNNTFRSNQ